MIPVTNKMIDAAWGTLCKTVDPEGWPNEVEMRAAIEAALAAAPQGEPAYSYACRLAESMYRRHYQEDISPAWTPLPDLLGVLTQIDNMVSGLVRREAARTALEALVAMQSEAAARSCGLRICDEAIDALREALGDAK